MRTRFTRRSFLIGMGALAGSLITGKASWAHHRPGHEGGPSPSPTPPPDPGLSGTRKLLLLI